jgi:hypothetical protein
MANLIRTGKTIKFLDVSIGQPFYKHDRFWIRNAYDAATELRESTRYASCCNFLIDACDEYVEEVKLEE